MKKAAIILLLTLTTFLSFGQTKVGLLFDQFASVRWKNDARFLEENFSEQGVETILKVAHSSLDKQLEQTQELIDEGVKAIVIVAVDGTNSEKIVSLAKANKVLVVAYDRPVMDENVDIYVSYNGLECGRQQAKSMVNGIKEGNIIMINGPVSDINGIQFREGQLEVLQPYIDEGRINVKGDWVLDSWNEMSALMKFYEETPDLSEIDGVLSAADWFNDALNEYAENDPLVDNIYKTGMDPTIDTIDKIKKGTQNMSIYKPLEPLAEKAVELTMAKLNDKDAEIAEIQIMDLTFHGYLFDPIVIDKDNASNFASKLQKSVVAE
ncbi:substrate-binding domain-containing protein [Reichenbachiella ulvae]|uniref:Substrate-binding domain-containing protein n=1 Tax=Reichenbachiella ulvae TaxID=2980104 RepID=A0ABT3CZS1_9BACT|nr:substrate-binding domain-containing protein [Reichenbachiella ulvae]MCV9389071.1 substrate-binding domain-containing protein [Reichenbachiella ulvae]